MQYVKGLNTEKRGGRWEEGEGHENKRRKTEQDKFD